MSGLDQWSLKVGGKADAEKSGNSYVKDTVTTWAQWAAVVLITVGLPVGMVAHWLLIGY